jgi:hypothetical protein
MICRIPSFNSQNTAFSSELHSRFCYTYVYHNVGLRMLLVVGAGGGISQASRDVNSSATHPS